MLQKAAVDPMIAQSAIRFSLSKDTTGRGNSAGGINYSRERKKTSAPFKIGVQMSLKDLIKPFFWYRYSKKAILRIHA